MIFVLWSSGDMTLCSTPENSISDLAEYEPNNIYFFADLCEPAEPKKAYFGWKEHPLIGGLLHEAYGTWHLGDSEEDQDYIEARVAESAVACPSIIYFYVEA